MYIKHCDGIEAVKLTERAHHRVHELIWTGGLTLELLGDEVDHNFTISLGMEDVAGPHQWLAQLPMVVDDAVVDESQPLLWIEMRMRVWLRNTAVGGPAGVSQTGAARGQARGGLPYLPNALL